MLDRTVPWIGLVMRIGALEALPSFDLPEGYGWRYFQPGDEARWARIETSAGEFPDPGAAMQGFRKYFPTDQLLDERMLFLTDNGIAFATATAWHSDDGPSAAEGRLHWVGIDAAHQRQGLSYPLVCLTLERMRVLGHRSAFLTTQTNSWPAIKVYHRFGFMPVANSEAEREGWRIVAEKTGIDFVSML